MIYKFTSINSIGIPVLSFPRTSKHFSGNWKFSIETLSLVCSNPIN